MNRKLFRDMPELGDPFEFTDPIPQLTVRDVMVPDPITVPADEPLQEVIRLMTHHKIGAVLVGDGRRIEGIFTERDLLRHSAEAPSGWRQHPVSEWMTRNLHTVSPDTPWEDSMAVMEKLHVRHLPVIEAGEVIGIVSARQLIGQRTHHLDRLVEERTRELNEIASQLQARDKENRRNLEIAGRLMTRVLLPHEPPPPSAVRWAVHFDPLDQLGGDYYDYVQPDERQLGVLIADASGHSLPAAMVAVLARIAFRDAVQMSMEPANVLALMNESLQGLTDERFVTAFYGMFDLVDMTFTFANAGHPQPIHYSAQTKTTDLLAARGLMLGVLPEAAYKELTVPLTPGDRFCFFTDGVPDAYGAGGSVFGTSRLKHSVEQFHDKSARALLAAIQGRLGAFRGGRKANDDMTLIVAEVLG